MGTNAFAPPSAIGANRPHCRIRSPCCVRRLSRGHDIVPNRRPPSGAHLHAPACFLHMPRLLCNGIPLWCSDMPRLRQTWCPLEADRDDSTASTLGCTGVTGDMLRGWGASTIEASARFLDVWVGTRRLSRGTTAESGSDGSMPSRGMNPTVLHVPLPCLRALQATRALVQASLWPCYRRVERSAGRHRCVSSCKPLSVSIESASRRIFGVHRDITAVRMVPATSNCAANVGAALHG
ncbi:UNVERIFIED_ORG: hypothetical protein J2811_004805 [Burkholderia cepacia]|nr:hypothetical protein [Burkholderia cepacia]PZW97501.1 hypothetical protein DFS13_1132 [Burkholderia sp. 28_3]RAS50612.1 hypothetical protein DFS07_113218 [Burkholderia cenocepacia]MDP9596776.1 hypothetical protein [Burkholderia cepacia]MDP9625341.1 hypothetical protein [Burkholderia cepacia]